jgi:hypothetical protein
MFTKGNAKTIWDFKGEWYNEEVIGRSNKNKSSKLDGGYSPR